MNSEIELNVADEKLGSNKVPLSFGKFSQITELLKAVLKNNSKVHPDKRGTQGKISYCCFFLIGPFKFSVKGT